MSRAAASKSRGRVLKREEIFDEWFPYSTAQLDAIEERNIEAANALCGGDWKSVLATGKANQAPDNVLGETKWVMALMMHHVAWATCSAEKGSQLVSIGSGTGSMLMGMLEMGLFSKVHGCEQNKNLAVMMKRLAAASTKYPNLPSIETGKFPKETPETITALSTAQAIFVCNEVFTEKNNVKIFKAVLQHAARFAVIITLRAIPRVDRELDERLSRVKCFQTIYDDVVTWHEHQQPFYVYYLDAAPLRVGVGSIGGAFGGSAFNSLIEAKIKAKEDEAEQQKEKKKKATKRPSSSTPKTPKKSKSGDSVAAAAAPPPSPTFPAADVDDDGPLTLAIESFDDPDDVGGAAANDDDDDDVDAGMFDLD